MLWQAFVKVTIIFILLWPKKCNEISISWPVVKIYCLMKNNGGKTAVPQVICSMCFKGNKKKQFNHLCLSLQATLEELKASYRRLCMLYHPDKHRDPELKIQAEQLFNQVHQAYEGKR